MNAIILMVIWFLVAAFAIVLYWAKQNGYKPIDIIKGAVTVVDEADKVSDIIEPLLPVKLGVALNVLTEIAQAAVHKIEKLYLLGDIKKENRKELAIYFVVNELKEVGIIVPPELQELIGKYTDEAVKFLPKTHK